MNSSLFPSSSQESLNLARKLRPRTFDQVVGQDMAVRMLKNSLYVDKIFPVYLFAGQRGCGKTSTARIFACAVNCEQLTEFRKNPALPFPCLTCSSCLSMQQSAHPDFIEIDAASNTGVDNVRQLIETAAYVPVAGLKKVYLIDEAHMLSKAAFNAFLKILEEPPRSVIFMLATTELHKVPQTVLSRCFQVTFGPLESEALLRHLTETCQQEGIQIEQEALVTIINETDGSARDALNLLEQVRFHDATISTQSVLRALGKLGMHELLDLLEAIINQNQAQLISLIARIGATNVSPAKVWESLVDVVKAMTWLKHGAQSLPQGFDSSRERLEHITQQCSKNRLLALLQLLWEQERTFLQTSKKQAFLEFLLLQLACQTNISDLTPLLEACRTGNQVPANRPEQTTIPPMRTANPEMAAPRPSQAKAPDPAPTPAVSQEAAPASQNVTNGPWQCFLTALTAQVNDAMLTAIFMQAQFVDCNDEGALTLQLKRKSKFFTDKVDETISIWKPLLQVEFPRFSSLVIQEAPSLPAAQLAGLPSAPPRQLMPSASLPPKHQPARASQGQPQEFISVNAEEWPLASLLVQHFPGRIKKLGPVS